MKKNFLTLMIASSFVLGISQNANAVAGIVDTNADGSMILMNDMTGILALPSSQTGQLNQLTRIIRKDSLDAKREKQEKEAVDGAITRERSRVERMKDLIPSADACDILLSVKSGKGILSNVSEKAVNSISNQITKQYSTANTLSNQSYELVKTNQKFCSDEDVKYGRNRCTPEMAKKAEAVQGLNVDPLSLFGYVEKARDKNGKMTPTGRTNLTIPLEKVNVNGKEVPYDGVAAATAFANNLSGGSLPRYLNNVATNRDDAGSAYNQKLNEYYSRKGIATLITSKIISQYTQMSSLQDFAKNNPEAYLLWSNLKKDENKIKSLYGDNYHVPEVPSAEELLQYEILEEISPEKIINEAVRSNGDGRLAQAKREGMMLKLLFDIRQSLKEANLINVVLMSKMLEEDAMSLERSYNNLAKGTRTLSGTSDANQGK